jgi:hypothetical protein
MTLIGNAVWTLYFLYLIALTESGQFPANFADFTFKLHSKSSNDDCPSTASLNAFEI